MCGKSKFAATAERCIQEKLLIFSEAARPTENLKVSTFKTPP
jgi:hypothetical protein